MPKKAKTFIQLTVQLVVILFVTEWITRFVYSDFSDDEYFLNQSLGLLFNSGVVFGPEHNNYHKKFGYKLSPNTEKTIKKSEFTYIAKTNTHGFREKEITRKDSGEFRGLFLGDSMFWGVGVDDNNTISALVEQTAKTEGINSFKSFNYAISGYNTVQEYLVAESYMDSLEADHLIVGFFVANDILPNAVAFIDDQGNYDTDAEVREQIKELYKEEMGIFFHSVFCRVMAMKVFIPRGRYQIASNAKIISKSYELLAKFNSLAKRKQVKLSIVILYPRDAVQGGMVQWWSQSRKPGALVAEYCRQQGIEVLDMIELMNTTKQKDAFYFPEDGHPNQAGNQFIANSIWNNLFSESFAPN